MQIAVDFGCSLHRICETARNIVPSFHLHASVATQPARRARKIHLDFAQLYLIRWYFHRHPVPCNLITRIRNALPMFIYFHPRTSIQPFLHSSCVAVTKSSLADCKLHSPEQFPSTDQELQWWLKWIVWISWCFIVCFLAHKSQIQRCIS